MLVIGKAPCDTLTLETDCLYEKGIDTIIRIRQMKTSTYEKPVSAELATLIRKAIAYTQERFGETKYIFVNENNPNKPMQYGTIQSRIVKMIREQNIRGDNGNLFGFGSHLYRHYYGIKLTEMHLDDWTIAKLLGHSNLKNVKYYRKMSNQILADDTRKARMVEEGERVTVPKLMVQTGLSRGFFYKNPNVRKLVDEAVWKIIWIVMRESLLPCPMTDTFLTEP